MNIIKFWLKLEQKIIFIGFPLRSPKSHDEILFERHLLELVCKGSYRKALELLEEDNLREEVHSFAFVEKHFVRYLTFNSNFKFNCCKLTDLQLGKALSRYPFHIHELKTIQYFMDLYGLGELASSGVKAEVETISKNNFEKIAKMSDASQSNHRYVMEIK